jgi:hypothetical protein
MQELRNAAHELVVRTWRHPEPVLPQQAEPKGDVVETGAAAVVFFRGVGASEDGEDLGAEMVVYA